MKRSYGYDSCSFCLAVLNPTLNMTSKKVLKGIDRDAAVEVNMGIIKIVKPIVDL